MRSIHKVSALAVIGLLAIAASFAVFASLPGVSLLALKEPAADLARRATARLHAQLPAMQVERLTRTIIVREPLIRLVQLQRDHLDPQQILGAVRWKFTWQERAPAGSGDEEKRRPVSFSVAYDFNGRLVNQNLPQQRMDVQAAMAADSSREVNETTALALAHNFLRENGYANTALELTGSDITRKDRQQIFTFHFLQPLPTPGLQNKIDVQITGTPGYPLTDGSVTNFEAFTEITDPALKPPEIDNTLKLVLGILLAVFWLAVGISLLVVFIKRLRHDELDFTRARWPAGLAALFTFTAVGISTYPDWLGVFLGGAISAVFTGIAALFAFAAAESFVREVRPEKVGLTDLIFRGHFYVREIGLAVLRAIFLAGISLALLVAGMAFGSKTNLGFLAFEGSELDLLTNWPLILASLLNKGLRIIFAGTLFFAFWSAQLQRHIDNRRLRFGVLALSLLIAGIYASFLDPIYVAIAFGLPMAVLWAYWVEKYDLFTLSLALSFVYLCTTGLQLNLAPQAMPVSPYSLTGIVLLGIFITGFILAKQGKPREEIGSFVPEYISRIAERERLLKELEIARRVQLQFLPRCAPESPYLDVCGVCRPAMEVGGDYFDFIQEEKQYFSVVIGDVSGKGVSAAFYMTMAKGIIKTVARKIRAPKLVLSELNAVFYENSPRNVFLSAIYGLFDLEARTFTFARAGHNPLVIRKSSSGDAAMLSPKGMAIGLDRGELFDREIEETTVSIEPGDIFVLFTDGLSESMNGKGEEFGEQRLMEIIGANPDLSAEALVGTIRAAVDRFIGDVSQHDDFTMVIVKILEALEQRSTPQQTAETGAETAGI